MRRIVFAIKRRCDLYLYGAVQVPSKTCDGCGEAYGEESLTPPYHTRCLPKLRREWPKFGAATHVAQKLNRPNPIKEN